MYLKPPAGSPVLVFALVRAKTTVFETIEFVFVMCLIRHLIVSSTKPFSPFVLNLFLSGI